MDALRNIKTANQLFYVYQPELLCASDILRMRYMNMTILQA